MGCKAAPARAGGPRLTGKPRGRPRRRGRPNRLRGHDRLCESAPTRPTVTPPPPGGRKLLFSATLTRNPSKLAPLRLRQPLYLAARAARYQTPKNLSEFMVPPPTPAPARSGAAACSRRARETGRVPGCLLRPSREEDVMGA